MCRFTFFTACTECHLRHLSLSPCLIYCLFLKFRRKSTEGVSYFLFALVILGNITYGLSVLVKNPERGQGESSYIVHHLPWLIGSLGTLLLDLVVSFQLQKRVLPVFRLCPKGQSDCWFCSGIRKKRTLTLRFSIAFLYFLSALWPTLLYATFAFVTLFCLKGCRVCVRKEATKRSRKLKMCNTVPHIFLTA